MRDQPRADAGPAAGDHVDHPFGQELSADLGQAQRRKRGMLAGLEHDRIARGDHRSDLPAGHHQGVVPRRNADADPQRIAPQHRSEAGAVLTRRNPRNGPRGPGEEAKHVDRIADIDRLGGADRLAAIDRFERGEFIGQFLDAAGDPEHPQRTFLGRHPRPYGKPGLGRGYCTVDLCAAGTRNQCNLLARGRIEDRLWRFFAVKRTAGDELAAEFEHGVILPLWLRGEPRPRRTWGEIRNGKRWLSEKPMDLQFPRSSGGAAAIVSSAAPPGYRRASALKRGHPR